MAVEWMIWLGAAITLAGLAGLVWSILKVRAARRDASGDEDLRARLQKVIPLNLGALLLSVLGLICVIFGLVLSA